MADVVSLARRASAGAGSFWSGLGQTQRVTVLVIGTIGIGLVALFLLWASNPAYSVAYSGLSEENGGAVIAKLKEMNVPYKLEAPGTILVPSENVQDVRLQLAMAKLPQGGGVGFELFDQANFGLTDFAQRVNYQRALEGELGRTIEKIEGVESARVHIVIPQQSLFTEAQKNTTASVVLKLRPGAKLSKSQLQGVSHLVAGSVEGLNAENLTVLDTRGNVLANSADPDGLDSTVFQTRAEAQKGLESQLEDNLRLLLDKTLGPDRTAVQVRAALDWDKVEQANETYSPDGLDPQVRSEHRLTEGYPAGGKGATGGVPGVGSNIPTYQQAQVKPAATVAEDDADDAEGDGDESAENDGEDGAKDEEDGTKAPASSAPAAGSTVARDAGYREESTINYEVSKKTERIVRAPGTLTRLSVAVAADSDSFSSDDIQKISDLVGAAAGIDAKRGDVLTVTLVPFDKTARTAEAEATDQTSQIMETVKAVAPLAGPVLLFLMLLIFLRRPGSSTGNRVISVKVPAGVTADQIERYRMTAGKSGLGAAEEPMAIEAPRPTERDLERQRVQQQIATLAHDNPQMLTQLIQTWIEEDK